MIKFPKLEDAHAMSVLHSSTFEIPSKSDIENLKIGDFLKVNCTGERFWCRLIFKHENDLIGIIDNELVVNHGLKLGDKIYFTIFNIYQIMK